jgi:hypothetical protein
LILIINKETRIVNPKILNEHPSNPRVGDVESVKASILNNGFFGTIVVQESTNYVLAGNHRLKAAIELELDAIPVTFVDVDNERALRILLADNRTSDLGTYDDESLVELLEHLASTDEGLDGTGYDDSFLDALSEDLRIDDYASEKEDRKGNMAKEFGLPPMSVIDTRRGEWLDRKRSWQQIFGDSTDGRDEVLNNFGHPVAETFKDTSEFDPALCEILLRWFSFEGAKVLDPFAGGCVRGVVSSFCGRVYKGFDIRPEQIETNREQFKSASYEGFDGEVLVEPEWVCGDSVEADFGVEHDFILSCPPYADLEVYSDRVGDLSNMEYPDFIRDYSTIIKRSVEALNDHSFIAWVVGEVRGKDGNYLGFVPDTIKAFEAAGARFYNEIILVNSIGTLPLRAGSYFRAARKVGKHHQNVLIFIKGDPKKATKKCGDVDSFLSTDERTDESPFSLGESKNDESLFSTDERTDKSFRSTDGSKNDK